MGRDVTGDDAIDQAIKASESKAVEIDMLAVPVTIGSTGRPCHIAVPADMTEAELIEVVSWMTRELAGHLKLRRESAAGGRIVLPFGRPQ